MKLALILLAVCAFGQSSDTSIWRPATELLVVKGATARSNTPLLEWNTQASRIMLYVRFVDGRLKIEQPPLELHPSPMPTIETIPFAGCILVSARCIAWMSTP